MTNEYYIKIGYDVQREDDIRTIKTVFGMMKDKDSLYKNWTLEDYEEYLIACINWDLEGMSKCKNKYKN